MAKRKKSKAKRRPRTYRLDPNGGDDGCMLLAKPKRKPKRIR